MSSEPPAKKRSALPIIHHAPAGSRYSSIEEAGRSLLKTNFSGFLERKSHQIIPPIFLNRCPEETDSEGFLVPGPGFAKDDLKGENNEKVGEDLEIRVFQQIEKIFGKTPAISGFTDPELFWRGMTIPKYKMEAFLKEYPQVTAETDQFRKKYTTKKSTTFGESDLMVLVQDVGLVVVEIKRSAKKIKDGIKQCRRMQEFASLVFKVCSTGINLPVVKVVIVGESQILTSPNADSLKESECLSTIEESQKLVEDTMTSLISAVIKESQESTISSVKDQSPTASITEDKCIPDTRRASLWIFSSTK